MYYKNYHNYKRKYGYTKKKANIKQTPEQMMFQRYRECEKSAYFNYKPVPNDFGILESDFEEIQCKYNEYKEMIDSPEKEIYIKKAIEKDSERLKKITKLSKIVSVVLTLFIIAFVVSGIIRWFGIKPVDGRRLIVHSNYDIKKIISQLMIVLVCGGWIFCLAAVNVVRNAIEIFFSRILKKNEMEKSIANIEREATQTYEENMKKKYGDVAVRYENMLRYKSALDEYNRCQSAKEEIYQYNQKRKQLEFWKNMDGRQFEEHVTQLFQTMGYQTSLTPVGADHGIDIIVQKDGKKYVVQCKHYGAKVQESVARDLYGVLHMGNYDGGFLVCLNGVTSKTVELCKELKDKPIKIMDLDKILKILNSY